jgi:hypothetical protein
LAATSDKSLAEQRSRQISPVSGKMLHCCGCFFLYYCHNAERESQRR